VIVIRVRRECETIVHSRRQASDQSRYSSERDAERCHERRGKQGCAKSSF
jgi:hypothetical protein